MFLAPNHCISLIVAAILTTAVIASTTMEFIPGSVATIEEMKNGLLSNNGLSNVTGCTDKADMYQSTTSTKNDKTVDPFEHALIPPTLTLAQWPHQSVLLQAGVDTHVSLTNPANRTTSSSSSSFATTEQSQALPIGIPIDFETSLFRGQFLVRLRNNTSDDPTSHDAYFHNRKRILQTVIQGQFKKNIPISDLYVGCVFRQPMKYAPPPFFMRLMRGLFQRIAPGVILDFASNQPRIISLYSAAAKAISIDLPGQEPDIASIQLPESLVNLEQQYQSVSAIAAAGIAGGKRTRRNRKSTAVLTTDPSEWTIADRQRILSNPDTASKYVYDTKHVYTMEIYDESLDYGKYEIKLPMYGPFNFSESIGVQPMTFTAVTIQNEILYDFAIWNESILQRQEQQQQQHVTTTIAMT
jgi:Protein of unknown function (DUF1769)